MQEVQNILVSCLADPIKWLPPISPEDTDQLLVEQVSLVYKQQYNIL